MNVSQRIRLCQMIERMQKNKELYKRLGMQDTSHFIEKKEKEEKRHENKI